MPRGDKDKYTDKQKRKAEHIEDSYKERGVSSDEAERRAWATVNEDSGGGNKSGSGRGKPDTNTSAKREVRPEARRQPVALLRRDPHQLLKLLPQESARMPTEHRGDCNVRPG